MAACVGSCWVIFANCFYLLLNVQLMDFTMMDLFLASSRGARVNRTIEHERQPVMGCTAGRFLRFAQHVKAGRCRVLSPSGRARLYREPSHAGD